MGSHEIRQYNHFQLDALAWEKQTKKKPTDFSDIAELFAL